MERTHRNAELNKNNVGEKVVLVGWVSKRRNLGSILFIDLRDRSGIIQVMVKEPDKIPDVRNEYVIQVKGTVSLREVANTKMKTGEIEIIADQINVINTAKLTPLIIADDTDALEDTRLKYRYLDLRREELQRIFITKSKTVQVVRNYLDSQRFIDCETPILAKSTPEGARDCRGCGPRACRWLQGYGSRRCP